MKKRLTKLKLSRETVRNLGTPETRLALGGLTFGCTGSCDLSCLCDTSNGVNACPPGPPG